MRIKISAGSSKRRLPDWRRHVPRAAVPAQATRTSAEQPATSALRQSSTPASCECSTSTATSGHASSPSAARAAVGADREQIVHREDVAPARLAPRDALELAQLLERVDPHVRVRADADPDAALQEPLDRHEAVAEVRLGRRADADARAGLGEQVELVPVRVRGVDDRRARAEAAARVEQLDRAQPVLGEALLDLARLLVGVDVQRQLVLGGVAPELLEPVARAGADGVGGDADADPGAPQRLELARYAATDSWRKRSSPPRA